MLTGRAKYLGKQMPWCKAQRPQARPGKPKNLPKAKRVILYIQTRMTDKLTDFVTQEQNCYLRAKKHLQDRRKTMIGRHKQERFTQKAAHTQSHSAEQKICQERLPNGLKAAWCWLTGKTSTIKHLNE